MEKLKSILADIWREACRHIKVGESVPLIAKILVQHLPISQLFIRSIDGRQLQIDTIAVGLPAADSNRYFELKTCTELQIQDILRWYETGKILHRDQSEIGNRILQELLPGKINGDVLAGPLGKHYDTYPVLLMISKRSQRFEQRHIKMVKLLMEPFTVVLNNSAVLRELQKLREAAEADKKSLLRKLNRKDVDDSIIGANKGLKNVMKRLEPVAKSDLPVLIFGETGTGKELIARNIHKRSNRSDGPFIRVNCGAIPAELIDSHLFGHERGSFTGAVDARMGWFERADGGTLFLDEIGEMPLDAQVRLLRILQDGWMERVGGKRAIQVDVRSVLATNQNIYSMVAEGKFREDLWYRVSTFPIFLPPLRERIEDFKELAEHFASRSAYRFSLPVLMPTDDDIKLLKAYNWPGNIRELMTVIDRAVLLGNGRQLEIAKSLGWVDALDINKKVKKDSFINTGNEAELYPLDVFTKRYIEKVLIYTRGKIEGKNGAASLLQINPYTLRGRMRKLGIDWKTYR